MHLVCLMSLYKEGGLAADAFTTAVETGRPVVIFEGPAGPPLPDTVPDTDYTRFGRATVHRGTFATDAEKRTAMIRYVQAHWQGPCWAVWVDGDELLMNARFLPGLIDALVAQDEHDGDPDEPVAGWPLLIVEADGSLGVCLAKCLRVDLIDEYIASSSIIRFKNGETMPLGNLPYNWKLWRDQREQAFAEGIDFLTPPLPAEPFIVHRSHLRHPLRRNLRLHHQERDELERLGLPR